MPSLPLTRLRDHPHSDGSLLPLCPTSFHFSPPRVIRYLMAFTRFTNRLPHSMVTRLHAADTANTVKYVRSQYWFPLKKKMALNSMIGGLTSLSLSRTNTNNERERKTGNLVDVVPRGVLSLVRLRFPFPSRTKTGTPFPWLRRVFTCTLALALRSSTFSFSSFSSSQP